MTQHIFGIRHHGPGSARSVRAALDELRPDIVLVEGPPDAAEVVHLLAHADMQPPVALLIYNPDAPSRAVYYPFTVFSPEWQAIHWALINQVPVRFMDLPQAHQLTAEESGTEAAATDAPESPAAEHQSPAGSEAKVVEAEPPNPRQDPLGWLGRAAGYSDGERWWEHMVEQRRDSSDMFAAILEAMTALREASPPETDQRELRREAWMRQTIRAAEAEGFAKIAVICGAWHGPALATMPPAKQDAALLKGLPKAKVAATWVPWTNSRLSWTSGYGAGVESPGWYQHLWTTPDDIEVRWLAKVARLLRDEDLDASSAHVIEAVRLADALAALRDRPRAGLAELNEATLAVICAGNDVPMRLIHDRLIVGETLGAVPAETPMVPLQADLQREQRRLRLPAEALEKTLDLDLRKPNDLDRSHLLHRLALLDIPWGRQTSVHGKTGTFHEIWRLGWEPELAVKVIEASIWGATLETAAGARAVDLANQATELPPLTNLVDRVLLAELTAVMPAVMQRLSAAAAVANDISHLMGALPSLANVMRYGNVRRIDTTLVAQVVDGLVARIMIGLPLACASLDDDAAAKLYERLQQVNSALGLLDRPDYLQEWRATLRRLSDQQDVHGVIAGAVVRLLLNQGEYSGDEVARRVGLALSVASDPKVAADWLEGLLRGSALVLLNDPTVLNVIDRWVVGLAPDSFITILPLVRRTFASFKPPERRQMGEFLRDGTLKKVQAATINTDRADQVVPLLAQLLGLRQPNENEVV